MAIVRSGGAPQKTRFFRALGGRGRMALGMIVHHHWYVHQHCSSRSRLSLVCTDFLLKPIAYSVRPREPVSLLTGDGSYFVPLTVGRGFKKDVVSPIGVLRVWPLLTTSNHLGCTQHSVSGKSRAPAPLPFKHLLVQPKSLANDRWQVVVCHNCRTPITSGARRIWSE